MTRPSGRGMSGGAGSLLMRRSYGSRRAWRVLGAVRRVRAHWKARLAPRVVPGGEQAVQDEQIVTPAGFVYRLDVRGLELLAAGTPAAAAALLEHAHRAEPESRSIREALA